MPTIASGNSVEIYVPIAASVTITPAAGYVEFGCSSPSGSATPSGRKVYAAETISVPAGGTIFMRAVGGSATYTDPAGQDNSVAVLSADVSSLTARGFVFALGEQAPIQTLTATGTAFTGVGEYGGFTVRAIVGASQTVTVYDATSATGTPIHTEVVSATGYFPWAGNKLRPLTTGCHVTISGGTSRTLDVLAG